MQVMIRCKLKPDQVEKCLELGRAVYDELASIRPDWLRQASFRLDDGVSIVTFAELDAPASSRACPPSSGSGAPLTSAATNRRS